MKQKLIRSFNISKEGEIAVEFSKPLETKEDYEEWDKFLREINKKHEKEN